MYDSECKGLKGERPPFLGYWVNLIPSKMSFASCSASNDSDPVGRLERIARGKYPISLGTNDRLDWMTPHHGLFVRGVSCGYSVDKEKLHFQVFASSNGKDW